MVEAMRKAAAAAFLMFGAATASLHAQVLPLKVGFLGSFSGPGAQAAQDQYDGFMLALELNFGRLAGVPIDVVRKDDQLKPDVAVQIVRDMIEKEGITVIAGVTDSSIMAAVQRVVTDKKVFLLGTGTGPSTIAGAQCSPYQFIVSSQDEGSAEAMGQYAADKGYKRTVLIAAGDPAGKNALAAFKRTYKGDVTDEIYVAPDTSDLTKEVSRIAASAPDAAYAYLPGPSGVSFVLEYQQTANLKTVPLLTSGMVDATTLRSLKAAMLGVVGAQPWVMDIDNQTSKEFVEVFPQRQRRMASHYAAEGYEAALLLGAALDRVKGNVDDKQAFMDALRQGNPNSVRGTLSFDNNHFAINNWYAYTLQYASDGRGVTFKTLATPLKNHRDAYHAQCPLK